MLRGKKALVLGVANKKSLAWIIANAWADAGAEVAITYQSERFERNARMLCQHEKIPVAYQCDVTKPHDLQETVKNIGNVFQQKLDLVLHSIAYAPADALKNPFLDTTLDSFLLAHNTSAYSFVSIAKHVSPLLQHGASLTALSYIGSTKVVPNYKVMGPAKASLEACVRQLAYEMGPQGVRVNCLNPGPISTLSARGIPGISKMIHHAEGVSPLGRTTTPEEVGQVATFLASDLASSITGQTLYADCGFSTMASVPEGI